MMVNVLIMMIKLELGKRYYRGQKSGSRRRYGRH